MKLAHASAVAALVVGSVTLIGCGGGGPTFKFVSFSFESKGTEFIVDGKVQATTARSAEAPTIKLMLDMDELKFLSSQTVKAEITQEQKTVHTSASTTVMIDIKAQQALIHTDMNMGVMKNSLLTTIPLGDIEPSSFSKCLAAEEANMKIKGKKVKVFSITLRMPDPDKNGDTVAKDRTSYWQVDAKNVPKEIITDFTVPVKAKPEDAEDKTMKLVQSTVKVSDKESQGGAPPSEVFQVPASWGADGKTTEKKDSPGLQRSQIVMPDAIWKCAGLPKSYDPMKPDALLVAQPQTEQARPQILAATAKDENVVV